MIRLLALDMDGTLLDSRKEILPGSLRALERAKDRGIQIVLSTGRGIAELRQYLPELPFVRYGVLESGALVYDFFTREALRKLPLDPSAVSACLDACEEMDAMPHFLTVTQSVVRADQLPRMAEYGHGDFRPLFEAVCVRTEDMQTYAAAHPEDILKVCMYHRTMEGRQRSRERLSGLGMDLRFSENHSLEATCPGANKGEGLRALQARLGILPEETAACGDADNDLEMLRLSGMSFAMGNASAHVRAAAGQTVRDNDSGGIEDAVDFILNEDAASRIPK